MFTTTTAANTTKTATKSTKKRSIRALALAGVMAIAASACSVGGTAVDADATKATSTTIAQEENTKNETPNDETPNDENIIDENTNDDSDNDTNNDDDDRTEAPESPEDDSSDDAPAPRPRPVPQPDPEPAYIVGACDSVDYPVLDTYQAYVDAELRTEPVIGTPVEVIFAGDIAYPYFTEFDCAVGDDGTVWWFIGTEFGTEAWVNAAWLDPVDLNEDVDYTAAVLHYVARDCIEQSVELACDELFSRNDGSADAIGSAFVTAYMAGDVATLDNLSTLELKGTWADLLPTEDIAGDGFGAESLSISGNTVSFVPFPTGGTTCYAEAGEIHYCSYSE